MMPTPTKANNRERPIVSPICNDLSFVWGVGDTETGNTQIRKTIKSNQQFFAKFGRDYMKYDAIMSTSVLPFVEYQRH